MSKIKNGFENNTGKKHYSKRKKKKHNSDKKQSDSNGLDLLPKLKQKTPRSSLPVEKVKKVIEPHQTCKYCNEIIENIASAIKGSEVDEFYHFDCILKKLSEEENLQGNEKLSYIGHGTFAVIDKDDEGKLVIKKSIVVETPEVFSDMKKYVEGIKK